jgi:hypothetical protein
MRQLAGDADLLAIGCVQCLSDDRETPKKSEKTATAVPSLDASTYTTRRGPADLQKQPSTG